VCVIYRKKPMGAKSHIGYLLGETEPYNGELWG
jgi:hypothetical protein